MDWDWQHTLPISGFADNGRRCLTAPLKKGDTVAGYMFSADAVEKLTTIAYKDVNELEAHGKTLVLRTAATSIEIKYKDDYLATRPSKRVCACWYYAPCNCCIEDREYELSDSEDSDDPSLPAGYSQKEDAVTRHSVDGPIIWVLGRFAR